MGQYIYDGLDMISARRAEGAIRQVGEEDEPDGELYKEDDIDEEEEELDERAVWLA
jgi:hypothetical protein